MTFSAGYLNQQNYEPLIMLTNLHSPKQRLNSTSKQRENPAQNELTVQQQMERKNRCQLITRIIIIISLFFEASRIHTLKNTASSDHIVRLSGQERDRKRRNITQVSVRKTKNRQTETKEVN
jgi:hypothetical protein